MAKAKRAEKRSFSHIGNFVKQKRLEAGFSQTTLAIKLGFRNGQFVSNVERGLCSIPEHKIKECADILSASPYEMIKQMALDYQANLVGGLL